MTGWTKATFSQLLAVVIPACLALYWPVYDTRPSLASAVFRPAILLVCLAFALLWYAEPVTRAEKQLTVMLALLCFVLLLPSLTAIDPGRSLQGWVKQVLICVVCVVSCRALRHPPTAKIFGISLLVAGAVMGALIVRTYIDTMGPVIPTFDAARTFKGTVQLLDIPLNNIAFDCIFAYVCGLCLVRNRKALWPLGLLLLLISTLLTGSRAPVMTLGLCGLALLTLNALRSRRLLVWVGGALLAIAMIVGPAIVVSTTNADELSNFTEGRWEMWSVAFQKFTQRPVLGYGFSSSEDDPNFIAGGYHNEYLTAMAEQGAVGTVVVLGLFVFLLRRGWRLAFCHSATWRNGQWALLGSLLLLVRAGVEVDGLLGYAQAPGDFLAYVFLAIVASRFSVEEDRLRGDRKPETAGAPAAFSPASMTTEAVPWTVNSQNLEDGLKHV